MGCKTRNPENPYEQEVRVEKPVTVAKAQKRADYTFYLAPNFRDVKFFVEAKNQIQQAKTEGDKNYLTSQRRASRKYDGLDRETDELS
jgi:hypothetical protein